MSDQTTPIEVHNIMPIDTAPRTQPFDAAEYQNSPKPRGTAPSANGGADRHLPQVSISDSLKNGFTIVQHAGPDDIPTRIDPKQATRLSYKHSWVRNTDGIYSDWVDHNGRMEDSHMRKKSMSVDSNGILCETWTDGKVTPRYLDGSLISYRPQAPASA